MTVSQQLSQSRKTLKDGTSIFYRFAGNENSTPFLLLHGYPASSFQYRNLIPILAKEYFVIAPDLPGFGFTQVSKNYNFTFDALSKSIEEFIDSFQQFKKPFPVYIFDYGAPTAMRIFLRRPELFSSIISQNGNAYEIGLGPAWEQAGIRAYWKDDSESNRNALKPLLALESAKSQYDNGHPNPDSIPPETYFLDYKITNDNAEAMLDLFGDYKNNVALYPDFSKALQQKSDSISILAIWGKHDPFFIPPGAEAFQNDVKNTKVILLDAGHFALESHNDEIAQEIISFLKQ